ncbi:MAG TPA: ABC transporter ATP-binding protein [Bacteroidales bacterium]|nr:ABC transporter ATP-binding protein [Bacteroidales bacterium]HPT52607.1 ABC transporter ATP-binding protein [Bacteroidales bacterium]
MIDIEHLSKSFEKQSVLKEITFHIPKGETICLLGPSGSGKTTLIRLILGAIRADSGQIQIDGTTVPNLSLLSRIGFMPQSDALYDNLSAMDNLAFFAGLYNLDKKIFKQRAETSFEMVGLTADKHKLVSKFSGGMKKRLSLAIATFNDPELLLLDEPTVGIDPVLRRSVWRQFNAWRNAGKTLLISTHVMDEVNECDKAALINGGGLIAYDSVSNLLKQTETGHIEELFIKTH